jgi:FMN phosphatase YigB (HAD superfamily)
MFKHWPTVILKGLSDPFLHKSCHIKHYSSAGLKKTTFAHVSSTLSHDKSQSTSIVSNESYKPELVLFSDTVLTPLRYPFGEILTKILPDYCGGNTLPAEFLTSAWNTFLTNYTEHAPALYRPGRPVTKESHERWHLAALSEFISQLAGAGVAPIDRYSGAKLVHRVYCNLQNGKSHFIPRDAALLLDTLKAAHVRYGVVTNWGPGYSAMLRELARRFRHKSYLHTGEHGSRSSLIPIVNASELGIAKPSPEIFRLALERLQPKDLSRVYYVGTDLDLDYAPAMAAGLKSVLLTRGFDQPTSDVLKKSTEELMILKSIRIKQLMELQTVFFDNKSPLNHQWSI